MSEHIRTDKSRLKVFNTIKEIPTIISGRARNKRNLHNKFWGIVAHSVFESMSKAFESKAQGQQDDLGRSWKDLTTSTKAYSRPPVKSDSHRTKLAYSSATLGLLTPTQHAKWRKIFGAVYQSNRHKLGEAEAKRIAGQIAWAKLKQQGARTKIDVLGSRDLLILRDTDRLFRSFLPGKVTSNGYRRYNKDQVYIVSKGEIEIGTKVEYADQVFEDRPLWFGDITPWLKKAMSKATKQIVDYLVEEL